MTREQIKTKDVIKMVNPIKVFFGCLILSGAKKSVDRAVR
jgi:hypothetical protein